MIRKILVPIRGDGKGENVLRHAALLAHRFSAHVVMSYCRARAEDMLPFGVPIPASLREQLYKQAGGLADAEEAKLKDEFHAHAAELGLEMTQKPNGDAPTANWVARPGRQVDVIKQYGRLADVICVAQPDRDRNLGANTLKSALFHTGRPVVMCPPRKSRPEKLGETVAIAWNGSTEAARAVALGGDIIAKASNVTILAAGSEEIHGASAEDLKDYLALRGKGAEILRFDAKGRIGATLLAKSKEIGADLMIMGAYGDSHEKETIFGGNTQTVVDKADTPIMLIH